MTTVQFDETVYYHSRIQDAKLIGRSLAQSKRNCYAGIVEVLCFGRDTESDDLCLGAGWQIFQLFSSKAVCVYNIRVIVIFI